MTTLRFRPDDIVFREGDPSDYVCEILSGEAVVVKELEGQAVVIGVAREGDYIGEMGVIMDQPRSATVRATTEMTAKLIEEKDFLESASNDGAAARKLLCRLSERLRDTSKLLAEVTVSAGNDVAKKVTPTPARAADTKKVTILAKGQSLVNQIGSDGVVVKTFPFLVGRQDDATTEHLKGKVQLSLNDDKPFRLSRVHFAILNPEPGRFEVRDYNSMLGTAVNDAFLGVNFASDSAALDPGDNSVIAGGAGSPFSFDIRIENGEG